MVDATGQQWLDFFDAGGRHDFQYNIPYLVKTGRQTAAIDMGISTWTTAAVRLGLQYVEAVAAFQYFGGQQAPTLGISGQGLHLPTLPLVRWEEIAAILFDNLRGTRHRASNAWMIADPGVGRENTADRTMASILVTDAPQLRSTISDSRCTALIADTPTPRGGQWGDITAYLDPALGAEQVVEFIYLLTLLCEKHSVRIYNTGGFTGILRSMDLAKQIVSMN
ncbi:MAG: hypothetical protein ABI400_06110 [Lacisediminihabitans sp.]